METKSALVSIQKMIPKLQLHDSAQKNPSLSESSQSTTEAMRPTCVIKLEQDFVETFLRPAERVLKDILVPVIKYQHAARTLRNEADVESALSVYLFEELTEIFWGILKPDQRDNLKLNHHFAKKGNLAYPDVAWTYRGKAVLLVELKKA
jgi:hypothetical protein